MKTEYALRAIHEIAGHDNNINREEISLKQNIPRAFLKNLLLDLKKAGLIKTTKGPGGGYRLARPKGAITVWDIYQAVDYRECKGTRCFPGMYEQCEYLEKCELKGVWFTINDVIKTTMAKMNLADLPKPQEN